MIRRRAPPIGYIEKRTARQAVRREKIILAAGRRTTICAPVFCVTSKENHQPRLMPHSRVPSSIRRSLVAGARKREIPDVLSKRLYHRRHGLYRQALDP